MDLKQLLEVHMELISFWLVAAWLQLAKQCRRGGGEETPAPFSNSLTEHGTGSRLLKNHPKTTR